MNTDGYPEAHELIAIKTWHPIDFLGLIDFIQERWAFASSGRFSKKWEKEKYYGKPELVVKMSTAGWSGNESIIDSLLENKLFTALWYYSWRRGGHYVFRINPFNVGYMSVAEMAAKKGVSRQAIHKNKDKYDWITPFKRSKLVAEKVEKHL
jgi:hypothetical protein